MSSESLAVIENECKTFIDLAFDRTFIKSSRLWIYFLVTFVFFASEAVQAMDLVVFTSPSCGSCQLFKREVLPAYSESPAGKAFPLRIILPRERVGFKLHEPVTFTPTFVWVEDGVEVGRFSGYFGRERFFRIVNRAAMAYRGRQNG
jgi:thioredoxin-related protein